jgi:hypothetical protein
LIVERCILVIKKVWSCFSDSKSIL